jgi:hypothetical protein
MEIVGKLAWGWWKKTEPPIPVPTHPPTALEERQRLLSHHVRMVARRLTNGLCVFGSRGGLGKTKVVLATLKEEKVKPLVLNGHITPLSLYTNLYEHSESIVFLDDCDSLFRNLPALGILRSALWGENNEARLVTYNSSQLKIPSSFHFTGRIIFAINTLPHQNHAFQAVLSRVDQFELDATNEEVLTMMRRLAVEGFGEQLTAEECMEIVNFVAEFSATRELSLRLLEPSYRKVIYAREAGVDWRQLVGTQLRKIGQDAIPKMPTAKTYDLDCLRQVVQDFPDDVGEQEKVWRLLTKRSRATFFRLKKILADETAGDALAVAGKEAVATFGSVV